MNWFPLGFRLAYQNIHFLCVYLGLGTENMIIWIWSRVREQGNAIINSEYFLILSRVTNAVNCSGKENR